MTQDPSQLSDAELLAIIGQPPQAPAQARQPAPRAAEPARPTPAPLSGVQGQIESILPGVRITSARRTPERNKAVGGAPNSYHLRGQAFDLAPPPGMSMDDLERQLRQSGLPFAELLNEGDHIHVAWNGEPVDASQAPAPAVSAMSDDELLAMAGVQPASTPQEEPGLDLAALARGEFGGPEEVVIDSGVIRDDGYVWTINRENQKIMIGSEAEWDALSPEDKQQRFSIAASDRSPEFMAEYEAARAGAENVPAWLANLSQGQSLGLVGEAVAATNFLDPFTDGVDRGTAYEAGRAAWRDRQAQLVQDDPLGSVGMQLAGGLLTPGLKGSGEWIGGATGAARLGRAGAVGGGYGLLSGAVNAEETDLASRGGEAARTGLIGAGVGAVGQRGIDRLGAAAAARRANPSPARLLSNRGVDLTPGQMMGGAAQRVEEGLQSFPVLGDSIKSARNRNMGTFDRAAINEALAPIGQAVKGSGRDAIREADDALSAEYGRILDPLTITPDAQFATDVQAALNPLNLSQRARDRLSDTVADVQARLQGPISGRDFKQIESELTGLIRSAEIGGPDGRPLVQPLRAVREALRANLRRQDPKSADDLAAVNTAYANFDRVRRAATNPTTARNDGLFSPGNLNSVLARTEGRNYGRGEARLQDLTDAGVATLGDKVPDSGTPLRSLLMMGAPGAGGLTMMGRGDVVAVTAAVTGLGSLGYGKVAQRVLNAVYRRSDPGATRDAMAELSRIASRDPAALPFYEQMLSALAPDQRPEPPPARAGLLSPTPDTRQGLLAQP